MMFFFLSRPAVHFLPAKLRAPKRHCFATADCAATLAICQS
jgi:hypothetical protein